MDPRILAWIRSFPESKRFRHAAHVYHTTQKAQEGKDHAKIDAAEAALYEEMMRLCVTLMNDEKGPPKLV